MKRLVASPDGYAIKLVRDRTAAILNPSRVPGELFYGPTDDDRGPWLRAKLLEEVGEYLEARSVEELSDVLAVVEALAVEHGGTLAELVEVMASDERGGFLAGQMMFGRHPEFDGPTS